MNPKRSRDPRYRANIDVGMRVVITEEEGRNLVPCYVGEILTRDAINELGIRVSCEDGQVGRVKYIGTETEYMAPLDLMLDLETKLRNLIAKELSRDDPDWWDNKIHPKVKEKVGEKRRTGKEHRQILQIPDYRPIDDIYFADLHLILCSKKNWKNYFESIFSNKEALEVKLSELSSYRNPPAHSNPLTDHIERKIKVYYDDIVSLLETHERRSHKQ